MPTIENDYVQNTTECYPGCGCNSGVYVPDDNDAEPEKEDFYFETFKNPIRFWRSTPTSRRLNKSKRYVAAEIEVSEVEADKGITKAIQKWSGSVVDDCSLPETGFEINTSPASGDKFLNQITDICSALKKSKAVVNDECGLHVHVDARDFTFKTIEKLMRLYAAFEDLLFQMVPYDRRHSDMCDRVGKRFLESLDMDNKEYNLRYRVHDAVYGEAPEYSPKHESKPRARFVAMNLHSWFYRGTVECRMFNGTVSAKEIVYWGMIWQRMLDTAKGITPEALAKLVKACKTTKGTYTQFRKVVLGGDRKLANFTKQRIKSHGNTTYTR